MSDEIQSAIPLQIIHEEAHYLLVNKPAGLFTQAAPGVPSLELQLAAQLKLRDQHPGNPFIGLPHRLDRATSGILLVARNKRALTRFGQQFQSRKVDKFYLTVLVGELPEGISDWHDSMRKIQDSPEAEIVEADVEQAKRAELRIEPLATADGRTLALVQLLTGRMHQIRLQASHRGWPIVGDRLYGTQTLTETELRELPHALHAYRLRFRHPQTATAVSYRASLPAGWSEFFAPQVLEQLDALVERSLLLGQSPVLQDEPL